jgi:HSP20 family protein
MAWELTSWKPFEFDRLRREMDLLWDSFLEGRPSSRARLKGEWLPSLDVAETKGDLVIKADLPGMGPKDIEISLNEGVLTIKGEKKQEKEEGYHLVERSYGTFTRSIRLPKDVQSEKISASFKDGVLKVVLPKSEEAKKKQIKIKVD